MKKIEAIVKPFQLEKIKERLIDIGVGGMTISEVRGIGRQRGQIDHIADTVTIDFIPKVKIEIVLEENMLDAVIEVIESTAKTGRIGDGKIFVSSVEQAIRIRTGERGSEAL